MSDTGDIWQRYDAKVLQIQQLEADMAELERELATARHERDHWLRVGQQLSKKLQVVRNLAERLRSAERPPEPPTTRRPAELQASAQGAAAGRVQEEFDRAREVLGLVLTALTRALDDDEAAELARRLRNHAGGKLLHSITRGSLTLVPVDGRYLVDRQWLTQLDVPALRRELDVAEGSGIYAMPEDSGPMGQGFGDDDLDVDVDDSDAYDPSQDLPPPPPLPAAGFSAPPPLLSALPDEDAHQAQPPRPSPADTVRSTIPAPPQLSAAALIPNLRIGRLIKTPGAG